MRLRNPCTLLLCRFLGWYVLFILSPHFLIYLKAPKLLFQAFLSLFWGRFFLRPGSDKSDKNTFILYRSSCRLSTHNANNSDCPLLFVKMPCKRRTAPAGSKDNQGKEPWEDKIGHPWQQAQKVASPNFSFPALFRKHGALYSWFRPKKLCARAGEAGKNASEDGYKTAHRKAAGSGPCAPRETCAQILRFHAKRPRIDQAEVCAGKTAARQRGKIVFASKKRAGTAMGNKDRQLSDFAPFCVEKKRKTTGCAPLFAQQIPQTW